MTMMVNDPFMRPYFLGGHWGVHWFIVQGSLSCQKRRSLNIHAPTVCNIYDTCVGDVYVHIYIWHINTYIYIWISIIMLENVYT